MISEQASLLTFLSLISVLSIVLAYGAFFTLWKKRRTEKKQHEQFIRLESRYLQLLVDRETQESSYVLLALSELDRLFQKRTGLSSSLINTALGQRADEEFFPEYELYLQESVNVVQRILSNQLNTEVSVSIKLLLPQSDKDDSALKVETFFRDSVSAKMRDELYASEEPYPYTSNSIMNHLISAKPVSRFQCINFISKASTDYKNPYQNWNELFDSTAVHVVSDPNSEDRQTALGFLCVDCKKKSFRKKETQLLLSIVSTAIYYCLYASSVLEYLADEEA